MARGRRIVLAFWFSVLQLLCKTVWIAMVRRKLYALNKTFIKSDVMEKQEKEETTCTRNYYAERNHF